MRLASGVGSGDELNMLGIYAEPPFGLHSWMEIRGKLYVYIYIFIQMRVCICICIHTCALVTGTLVKRGQHSQSSKP